MLQSQQEILLITTLPNTSRRAQGARRSPFHGARSAAAALAALAAIGLARAQTSVLYSVTALPLSSVTALNDSGLILGRAFLPCSGLCSAGDVPVLYDTRSGALTALEGGSAASVQFDAINALGQLAGSSTTLDAGGAWVRSVFVRQPDGTLTTLGAPTLSATQTSALRPRGFNAAGQVALEHSDGLDAQTPLCGNYQGWIGGTAGWQPLGSTDMVMHLNGINAGGVAAGAAVPAASCGGAGNGFRAMAAQPGGALVDLHGSMPGSFSRANAINDLGYAAGDHDSGARTLPDANFPQAMPIVRAAVWNTAARAWFDLGPAGSMSRLNAVNNRGEVVGSAEGQAVAGQPYVATTARALLGNLATTAPLVDLNTLLTGNTEGWVLHDAVAINAGGQIVARGASPAGSGLVLLTPLSPPPDPYSTVPSAPASLAAAQLTAASAQLSWTNTARNATRLVVERCKGKNCTGFAAVATLPGDSAAFADTTLARATAYRWRVSAGNAAGLSAPSNVVSATTLR
jgi:hypothetical protein